MWNPFMQDPLLGPLLHGMGLGILFPLVFMLLILWSLGWKAIALWHAARNGQRIWFVALLLVNSVGILEIIYLKWFEERAAGEREKVFPFLENATSYFKTRDIPPGPQS